MTKLTYVSAIETVLNGGEITPEITEKLKALKTSLTKRSGGERKPTKVQVANEGIKNDILEGMVFGERYTITDLIKGIPAIADYSNQKISALVSQLVKAGVLKREEDGRKTYFSLV